VNESATEARSATPATASAVTEASATLAAAMRATCFLPADAGLVMVMSACPGSCVRVLAAGTARTNGASGPGHQAASVAVTAAGRSGRDGTCRCRGAG
jgi:hypothetical protein